MHLQSIILRRQQALLGSWLASPFFQIQVDTPTALGQLVFIDDDEGDGTVGALGRRRGTSVAIVERGGDPDRMASVWVSSVYDDYRGAYVAFVNKVYGGNATKADLAGYDVDHLLNRARSPKDSTFIRIEAIPAAVNQRWGTLYEKTASNPSFFANQSRERRIMSWMVASKFAGQMPPAGPDDTAGIARLADFWAGQGFPREQALHGITEDLNFVFGRPHGGVVTPTTKWL